jgi:hypothetical protein
MWGGGEGEGVSGEGEGEGQSVELPFQHTEICIIIPAGPAVPRTPPQPTVLIGAECNAILY